MAHALLSPSASHRWLECTPSARLESTFADTTSEYAEEGSLAHSLAELELRRHFGLVSTEAYENGLEAIQAHALFSPSMRDHIDVYVALVARSHAEALQKSDVNMAFETRVDITPWVKECFGTADAILVSDGLLEIIDFKYGKGVPVRARDNPQMKLYALGAYNTFSQIYIFDTIKMTICQPRLDSMSSYEISLTKLLRWADKTLKPKAALAHAGLGDYKPGEHCRFCRAGAICRARADANLALAAADFYNAPAATLTPDEIAQVLTRAAELQHWVGAIEAYAHDQAVNHGVTYPGWKVVEGRSNRCYLDKELVASALIQGGCATDEIYKTELLGITALESAIGKKRLAKLAGSLIVKPPGKPVLVPKSDKRAAIKSLAAAQNDFND